jgi:hypothetical protein
MALFVVVWILLLTLFLPLSVSAVSDLASADPCAAAQPEVTGSVDSKSWVPPRLVCRFEYPDGSVTEDERNYWAVFVPSIALAVFAGYQTQRRVRARRAR